MGILWINVTGASGIAQRGENWDISHVGLVIRLMTAGVVTPTGTIIASVLRTAALGLGAMLLVAVTVSSMLLLILVMMTL